MRNDDDEDKTPTESPSAMQRLGLAVCPKCEGARFFYGERCPMCNGGGRVTLSEFNRYIGLHDTIPPDTDKE